ncbi:MAG: homoserine kinase [Syntrophomonadaceae bacterium]|jgi:homoserine kinase
MITVRVPATSANLGPGFDTLGIALQLFLQVAVETSPNGTRIIFCGDGEELVEEETDNNLIKKAIDYVYAQVGLNPPYLRMTIQNAIPIKRGLGSSAAAIAAGVFLGNELLNNPFTVDQLIKLAVDLEGHADNIVPAIIGGLTTVLETEQGILYHKVPVPGGLTAVVAVPDFTLSTEKSRSVLPPKTDLAYVKKNLQRACFLLAGMFHNDLHSINTAMEDFIYQPARKGLIPGFDKVVDEAIKAGALGVALSGAGPSVIAFTVSNQDAIGRAMAAAFNNHGIKCRILHLQPSLEGVAFI